MVQAQENLTQLVGTVVATQPHSELPGYETVTVQVEQAQPVEGKANMIAAQPGERMDVSVRRELLEGADVGSRIRFRAKRTVDGVMSEPHPEPGDFTVE